MRSLISEFTCQDLISEKNIWLDCSLDGPHNDRKRIRVRLPWATIFGGILAILLLLFTTISKYSATSLPLFLLSFIHSSGGTKALRATFEDVLQAQTQLRRMLKQLIRENRPIRDDNERDRFFGLFARSTLGLGHQVKIDVGFGGNEWIRFSSVDEFAGCLAYYKQDGECRRRFEDYRRGWTSASMGALWDHLILRLYLVWSLALDRASSISAEHIPYEKMRPKHVGK